MKHCNRCPVCEARFRPLPFCFWHARRRCPVCGSVYRLSRLGLFAVCAVAGLCLALLVGFGLVPSKALAMVLGSLAFLAVFGVLRYWPPLTVLERRPQHGEHNTKG
jgi:hypothetical protein